MIDQVSLIKIKNGWVITTLSKGIFSDRAEDHYVKSIDEACVWLKENIHD